MNANVGSIDPAPSRVVAGTHPPVILSLAAKADNGTLAAGLLVALDSNGDIDAYDSGGVAPLTTVVGVLTQELDTTEDTTALVLKHGTVNADLLLEGSSAADAAAIAALEAIGIFAV